MGEKVKAVIKHLRSAGTALASGIGQSGKTTVEVVRQSAGLQLGLLASVGSAVEEQLKAVTSIRDSAAFLHSQRKFGEALYDGTLNYVDGLREAGFGAQAGWSAAASTVASGFGLNKRDN